jgi:hypothetical protein
MGIERATAALAALALLCACAGAPATPDLATFLQRRDLCEHFRGEFADPPDPERQREIDHGLAQYCTGTDAQLAQLKQRYRDDPAITKQLAAFEPKVEATTR